MQPEQQRKSKTECRNYAATGTCDYGENCKFTHIDKGKGKNNNKDKEKNKREFKGNCFNCGEQGHIAEHCKKKKKQAYIVQATEPASDSDEVQGMYMLDHETDYDYETDYETCPSKPKTCPSKTCLSDTD